MLKVGEAGHDDAVEVGQDGVERLGRLRWVGGEGGFDFAGCRPRHHGPGGYGGPVVGNAVDDLVAEAAELFGSHDCIFCNIACRTSSLVLRKTADCRSPIVDSPPRLSLETYVEIVRKYARCISTVRRYEFERKGDTGSRSEERRVREERRC